MRRRRRQVGRRERRVVVAEPDGMPIWLGLRLSLLAALLLIRKGVVVVVVETDQRLVGGVAPWFACVNWRQEGEGRLGAQAVLNRALKRASRVPNVHGQTEDAYVLV